MDTMIPNYMKSSTQKASGWSNFLKGFTNVLNPLGMVADVVGGFINYNQQKKAFDYQRELNQTMMSREDTAMQRRMADLKASGLNPLLALGTPGASASSGSVGSAPQFDTSLQNKFNEIRMAQNEQRAFNETIRGLSLDNTQKLANIEYTDSETKLKEKQAQEVDQKIIESQAKINELGAHTENLKANTVYIKGLGEKTQREIKELDLKIIGKKYENKQLSMETFEKELEHYWNIGSVPTQYQESALIQKFEHTLNIMKADEDYKKEAIEYLKKQIKYYGAQQTSQIISRHVHDTVSCVEAVSSFVPFGPSRSHSESYTYDSHGKVLTHQETYSQKDRN